MPRDPVDPWLNKNNLRKAEALLSTLATTDDERARRHKVYDDFIHSFNSLPGVFPFSNNLLVASFVKDECASFSIKNPGSSIKSTILSADGTVEEEEEEVFQSDLAPMSVQQALQSVCKAAGTSLQECLVNLANDNRRRMRQRCSIVAAHPKLMALLEDVARSHMAWLRDETLKGDFETHLRAFEEAEAKYIKEHRDANDEVWNSTISKKKQKKQEKKLAEQKRLQELAEAEEHAEFFIGMAKKLKK